MNLRKVFPTIHLNIQQEVIIKQTFFVLLAIMMVGVLSCKNNETAMTKFEISLTDSPGDYQEVNIDVQDVQVNSQTGENGWKSLEVNKGVYNILSLTNGLEVLLGTAQLPVGHLSQIRLVLGVNNTLKMNGQIIALTTPSAQQSGLKLQINADLQEGVTYKLLLDFDAAKSIVSAGNSGKYNLKPVIRVISLPLTGAIKGLVTPIASTPAVYAIVGKDTLATAYADLVSGKFLLQGLNAGPYLVSFAPKTGYLPVTKINVGVTVGAVTDLGTVEIQK